MAAITPNWADKPHNMAAIYKLATITTPKPHSKNKFAYGSILVYIYTTK